MLLKVMPLGCRATSGSLATYTCPVDKCGSNTAQAHTQQSSPTPTVTSNTTPIPKPPQSSFPSSSYISRCDLVPCISYPDLFHCLHLELVQVLQWSIRVSFPHRILRHCWAQNCPDTLWLFRIHFRVRAVHPSIVQVLGDSFVTDSLDQLSDVMGNVQPFEYCQRCCSQSHSDPRDTTGFPRSWSQFQ